MKPTGVKVYPEMDPLKPDYWVGQKITLPYSVYPEDWELSQEEEKKLREAKGTKILITHVEVDVDGTAPNAYYGFITQDGFSSNMNFLEFPREMAAEFGYGGWDHFGKKIPLNKNK